MSGPTASVRVGAAIALLLVTACGGGDASDAPGGGGASDATTSRAASEFCTQLTAVAEHQGGMSTPEGKRLLRDLLAVSPESAQAYPRLVLHFLEDPIAAMDDNSVQRLDKAGSELNKAAEEECGITDVVSSSSLE